MYLIFIVISNYRVFKKCEVLFINYYAFGHSVTDTSAFFSLFPDKGICISIGSNQNRNKYFKDLYKPCNLVFFWLPILGSQSRLKKLSGISATQTKKFFNSKRVSKMLGLKPIYCINREFMLEQSVINHLHKTYKYTLAYSRKLSKNFKKQYDQANLGHSSHVAYFILHKNPIKLNFSKEFNKLNSKFLSEISKLKIKDKLKDEKICTVILRKSQKNWSGEGISGFIESILYLRSQKYIICLIGDTKNWQAYFKHNVSGVYSHESLKLNEKAFQLLAVYNSVCCIGDPGGAQVLPHFFSKPNLVTNVIPVSQLYFNGVSLPKIWKSQNGKPASVKLHLNQLVNLDKYFEVNKKVLLAPSTHGPNEVLLAVMQFISLIDQSRELSHNKTLIYLCRNKFSLLKFANHSSFSPIFKNLIQNCN